jgi:putative hemolysin
MIWQEILFVLLLILLNGFFAMAELALFSSRRPRLQQYAREGRRGAATALKLLDDPTGFLSTVQVGITVIAILLGAYGEAAFAERLSSTLVALPVLGAYAKTSATVIIIALIAFLSLMMGELIPKRLALRNPERLACSISGPMRILAKIAYPAVWFLRKITELTMRLIASPPSVDDPQITEEEVKSLIVEGTKAGVFEPAEKEMLEGVLRVADRTVRSIMTPRPDIVWLNLSDSVEEIYQTIAKGGHSRFPVATDDVDTIIGIVHSKDLLEQVRTEKKMDLKSLVRDPIYIHEGTPILSLLDSFRASPVHLAVVLDEHGTIQGMVTPTDILEAIAGDLPEHEDETPSAQQRADGSWLLDGQMPVHEVERTLAIRGLSASEHEYTTLAGFVISQFGHIPKEGEFFDWKVWRFEVVDLDGRRIDKVMVKNASKPDVSSP